MTDVVLHVGPDTAEVGGMGSVIARYQEADLGRYRAEAVAAYSAGSRIRWLACFVRAAITIATRRRHSMHGLHLHVSERFDLVRSLVLLEIGRLRHVPAVVSIHSEGFFVTAARHPRLARMLLARAAEVTVLSSNLPDAVAALGARSVQFLPNPMAVPSTRGETAPIETREQVLFAGVVSAAKGVDVLLRAWPRVRAAHPELTLHILGPVVDEELIGSLPDGVRLSGPSNRRTVERELNRSRIAVLPSRTEALPMFVLEAMALGVPVVATPVGAIPEAVGEAGQLVPVGDPEALAKALASLAASTSALDRASRAGVARIARFYSDRAVFGRVRELYDDVFGVAA